MTNELARRPGRPMAGDGSSPSRLLAVEDLQRQGWQPFLPFHLATRRHARKFRAVRAPIFPRYLFVGLDLARDRWRSVNGTVGVQRLVMAGDQPLPVPVGVVETLMQSVDSLGNVKSRARACGSPPARLPMRWES